MIEEQYVSFDTSLMLKEAGFDERCRTSYYATMNVCYSDNKNSELQRGYVSRPTQAFAARWLREVHNIHVFAFFDYVKRDWCYCIANLDAITAEMGMDVSENNYPTYEQTLEVALQQAIKLIK